MFAEENKKLIEQAIKNELEKITAEHGERYHTPHEGYAVLLEEIEEAESDLRVITELLGYVWDKVKSNSEREEMLTLIHNKTINLALEAVQISAVCEKFQRGTVNR